LGMGLWEDRAEGTGKDRIFLTRDRLAELSEKLLASGNGPVALGDDESVGLYRERESLGAEYSQLFGKLVKRAYSISDPILDEAGNFADLAAENTLEFYFAIIREGGVANACPILTPRLALLGEGDRLFIQDKIAGLYTLDGLSPEGDVVFAATGTGEAPHNAMIAELLRRGHKGKVISIVSARYWKDLAYLDVHRRLEEAFSNYRYAPLTTRNLPPGTPKRYIQDFIKDGSLEEILGKPLDSTMHFFLCGNPHMVGAPKRVKGETVYPETEGVTEVLESRYEGFSSDSKDPSRNIHYELYW
jgi:ferredoxin--NADP+ reductase